jgi:hypothetical protein
MSSEMAHNGHRVVTVDLTQYLGHHVSTVVPVRYREHAGIPAELSGGMYFVCVAYLPEGPHVDSGYAFEDVPGPAYGRLKTEDNAHLLEIWGWERQSPVPEDIPEGYRALTVDMALHIEPSARIDNATFLCNCGPDKRAIVEAQINTARDVLNRQNHGIYDTLDYHPAWLRAAVESTGQPRRETTAEEPPEWVPPNERGVGNGNGNGNGNGPP